jgi:hypothetical protein
MKTFIAFAASVAINFAMLGALDWSVSQAQVAPSGEVSITQLPADGDVAALAHVVDLSGRATVLSL